MTDFPFDKLTDHLSPTWRHVLPFVAWLVLMTLLPEAAWSYAVRAGTGLALFLWLRPWAGYPRVSRQDVFWGIPAGIFVFVVWVLPEASSVVERFPGFYDTYLLFGFLPPWKAAEPSMATFYAPESCGWFLSIIRLAGSAVVIAVIEEFFWRGFLYRWIQDPRFTEVSLATFSVPAFAGMVLLFGVEHQRWLAGIAAGAVYGGLMIGCRSIWAPAIAHVVTNLLLGIYVLATGSYQFW